MTSERELKDEMNEKKWLDRAERIGVSIVDRVKFERHIREYWWYMYMLAAAFIMLLIVAGGVYYEQEVSTTGKLARDMRDLEGYCEDGKGFMVKYIDGSKLTVDCPTNTITVQIGGG